MINDFIAASIGYAGVFIQTRFPQDFIASVFQGHTDWVQRRCS